MIMPTRSYAEEQLEYYKQLETENKEETNMMINICGIPHKIIFSEDNFSINDMNFGYIDYGNAVITINEKISEEQKIETLCHEIIHGIFFHIGREDLSENEQLVQALGNAIYQSFDIKYIDSEVK